MSDPTAANYLRDLGDLVKRSALDARTQRDRSLNERDREFESGRLFAYHEVVSLMQQQAVAFGIELDHVGLDHIDPETDLL